jgi:ABC-type uncharacterized transport system substrate-binding protein
MFNPDTAAPVSGYMSSFETAARSLKVVSITAPIHSDVEIETAIIALGREPGGGLVVIPDAFALGHRASIISAAARNNVPAVYAQSDFARDGGLLSYGVDLADTWRRAATYVDRILRGAKPAELPVQLAVAEVARQKQLLETERAKFAAELETWKAERQQRSGFRFDEAAERKDLADPPPLRIGKAITS